MPLPLFQRIATEVLPRVSRMSFSVAGEATLAPRFLDFLDLVNALPLETELVTNGTLLHREGLLPRLLPRLALLIASLDGARATTVERLRAGARYDKVMQNLGLFQAARVTLPSRRRPQFQVAVTLSTANIDELPAVVELAARLGADGVVASWLQVVEPGLSHLSLHHAPGAVATRFAEARTAARAQRLGLVLPEGEPVAPPGGVGALAGRLADPFRRRALLARALQRGRVRAWELRSGLSANCTFLWGKVYLHADGRVSPCCVQGRPYVGSLYDRSFAEIWTGPKMTALRAGLHDGAPHAACARCSQGQGPTPAPKEAFTAPVREADDARPWRVARPP
jgi:MoaA/NifB/PqqE/SkfB family radical SAM enzyme